MCVIPKQDRDQPLNKIEIKLSFQVPLYVFHFLLSGIKGGEGILCKHTSVHGAWLLSSFQAEKEENLRESKERGKGLL